MKIRPWRADVKRWLEQPPQVKNGSVYTASRHHQVQAMDASDGSVLWTSDSKGEILESPKFLGNDTVLIQGQTKETGSLTGLDGITGKTKWTHDFSPRWKFDETVLSDGSLLVRRSPYAGNDAEPMLSALSPETGEALWSVKAESNSWGVPVTDSENRIFVGLSNKDEDSLMAIDGQTGRCFVEARGPKPGGNLSQRTTDLCLLRDKVCLCSILNRVQFSGLTTRT